MYISISQQYRNANLTIMQMTYIEGNWTKSLMNYCGLVILKLYYRISQAQIWYKYWINYSLNLMAWSPIAFLSNWTLIVFSHSLHFIALVYYTRQIVVSDDLILKLDDYMDINIWRIIDLLSWSSFNSMNNVPIYPK